MGLWDTVSGIVGGTINLTVMLIIIIIGVGVVVGLYFWYKQQSRYDQFDCIIFFRDAFGNMQGAYDKAGIFLDKYTNNKRFYLKDFNVGLSPDNVRYLTINGKKKVFLFKKGLKNFSFLNVNVVGEDTIKLEATEEDVNWAINEFQKVKQLDTKPNWQQWLPYIALTVTGIIILIMFVWFFKQFPILKEVALSLKETAQIIAETGKQCTTTVIS